MFPNSIFITSPTTSHCESRGNPDFESKEVDDHYNHQLFRINSGRES